MSDIESLLSQFQPSNNQSSPVLWGDQQENIATPEDEDGERLEQSIREVFSNKQLLNKALATFLGVFAASSGVSLMTYLGIGALANGTLGSIVLGLFFANTLTKIQYDGRIHIDRKARHGDTPQWQTLREMRHGDTPRWTLSQEFIVAAFMTGGVGVALWIAFDEYRAVSGASKTGKTRFYQEVKDYEVKPVPATDTPWLVVGVLALGLLALAAILRGKR